ncbi:Ig-like domain-containing protein [Carboxylicivirga marina]|uniref:Ig-like domain-containing protein n=1 Tax=Carboxylicivirga marina TaxID=2800988 RepID=UPI002595FA6D|nr:Ig-like domain-containing protein [uncultured Carboxylicivirga sp.]
MRHIYAVLGLLVLFGVSNVWGQSYNSGYPKVSDVTETTATVTTNITVNGYTTSIVVLPSSAAAPTVQNVMDWTVDGNGGALIVDTYGDISVPARNGAGNDYTLAISNLTGGTDYIAYCVTSDDFTTATSIETTSPTTIAFRTLDPPGDGYNDGYPGVSNIGDNGARITTNLNASGYYTSVIIMEASATKPTIQNVLDWTLDGNGGSIPAEHYADIDVTGRNDANTDKFFDATNLTALTSYIAYCVTSSDFTAATAFESSGPTEISFTTSGPLFINEDGYNPGRNTLNASISDDLVLTFNQEIQKAPISFSESVNIKTMDGASIRTYSFGPTSPNPDLIASGNTFTIRLNSDLPANTQLYVTIPGSYLETMTGVAFDGILSSSGWSFTTLDDIAPSTSFTPPAEEATSIPVYSTITISYDEQIRLIGGGIIDNSNVGGLINISPSFTDFTAVINAEKTEITITPNSAYSSNTAYSISVQPVEDYFGNAQGAFQTSTFTTADYLTWTGGTSSVWDESSNWSDAFVAGSNVCILQSAAHMPIIDNTTSNDQVGDLVLEAGTNLTISDGGSFVVTGQFVLQSSNNSSIGNATFVNKGTLNVLGQNVKVMQSITNASYPYYFSSPVVGATPSSIGSSSTFYYRDAEGGGSWGTISSSTAFDAGIGYVAYDAANSVWEFSGDFNNDDSYAFSAYRTTTPKDNYGWNLAGNPYPCSIDWDVIYSSLDLGEQANFDNAFWLRINDTGQQGTYNGDVPAETNLSSPTPSHIPSMHAFYTKVTIGQVGGELAIPKASQTATTHTYLKGAKSTSTPASVIKLVGKNNEWTDETVIAFKPEAEEAIEKYDSEKIFASNNNNLLELYTHHNSKMMTIDSYPDYDGGRAVCLGYKCAVAGDYSILLKDLRRFDEAVDVSIEDKLTGEITSLGVSEEYVFTTEAGDFKERFIVHISQEVQTPTSLDEIGEDDAIVYSNMQTVYIRTDEQLDQSYSVYELSGKKITEGPLNSSSLNVINVSYKGLVIVKVNSGINVKTNKLFLK